MEKKICFAVDSDIYEKFCLALNLTNESENVAIETCMRWYIAKSFEKASQEYNPKAASRLMKAKIITEKQFSVFYMVIKTYSVQPQNYQSILQGSRYCRRSYFDNDGEAV